MRLRSVSILVCGLICSIAVADDLLGRGSGGGTGGPAADRPRWSDQRSLLDESRPPGSTASEHQRQEFQSRSLPQFDDLRHDMNQRRLLTTAEIIEEFDRRLFPYRSMPSPIARRSNAPTTRSSHP